ncbi:MAG: DNA polymerase III subunit delta [Dehalococcoidales bacterium]
MLYILYGPDGFSRTEALAEIKKGLGDEVMLASNTNVFEGKKITPSELSVVAQAVPFLSEKRLIIIEGLLEKFDSKAPKSRGKKTTKASSKQNETELFTEIFLNHPESTVIVLVGENEGKNNPLLNGIISKAKVSRFPLLRGLKLIRWIEKRVAEKGGKISSEAAKLLEKQTDGDLWALSGEIDKLISYALGRQIEEDDVNKLVANSRQVTIFDMTDAVLGFRAENAQRILQQLLLEGMAPPFILSMITREVRQLIQIKAMLIERKPQAEIRAKTGLQNDFVWNKTSERANTYHFNRLKDLYHKLLETDIAIKTGKYNDELALNILIAEMCAARVG